MKIIRIVLCIILLSQIIACSASRPFTQPVKFTCEPSDGVTLVVSGKKYDCPVTVDAPRNREMSIEAYKDGYQQYKKTVSYHGNTTFIVLDVVGGCMWAVPFLGLLTPGTKDLDETDIYVKLMSVSNQPISPNAASTKP